MKLSQALREKIHFEINRTGPKIRYQPLAVCIRTAFPEAFANNQVDVCAELFPLAFAEPLFPGEPEWKIVNANIAPAVLPSKANIYFLADAIDCLAVKYGKTEAEIADMVERIEHQLEEKGSQPVGPSTEAGTEPQESLPRDND